MTLQPEGQIWQYMCVCVLSCALLFASSWIVARKASLSMEFSKQEHWIGLQFPALGDLPNPGIKPAFPALADGFFTTVPTGKL